MYVAFPKLLIHKCKICINCKQINHMSAKNKPSYVQSFIFQLNKPPLNRCTSLLTYSKKVPFETGHAKHCSRGIYWAVARYSWCYPSTSNHVDSSIISCAIGPLVPLTLYNFSCSYAYLTEFRALCSTFTIYAVNCTLLSPPAAANIKLRPNNCAAHLASLGQF